MTKSDYIKRINERTGITKKDIGTVLDELFNLMTEDLQKNEKIMITNFGTFETSLTKPFDVYSPYDGTLIEGITQTRVHFKSSAMLKNNINKK